MNLDDGRKSREINSVFSCSSFDCSLVGHSGAQWELDFWGAKDIIFPMSCSFSKNFRQCSIIVRISDRLGARGL